MANIKKFWGSILTLINIILLTLGFILIFSKDCDIMTNYRNTKGIVYSITNSSLGIYYTEDNDFKKCYYVLNNNHKNYQISDILNLCVNKNVCKKYGKPTNNFFFGIIFIGLVPTFIILFIFGSFLKNYYFNSNDDEISETNDSIDSNESIETNETNETIQTNKTNENDENKTKPEENKTYETEELI